MKRVTLFRTSLIIAFLSISAHLATVIPKWTRELCWTNSSLQGLKTFPLSSEFRPHVIFHVVFGCAHYGGVLLGGYGNILSHP